ncbi:MAG: type II secretion system protein M [Gammaproteobacteria bacterium]|nr:type II secretion system protein M [Gammaproteobacteria bacterium]MBT8111542.1 type II secretion system protein M [Gammaproteobacteria bacterium]NND47061.1 type II secretion system protein M [Woeseiaceae bacterium]NNL46240.1 type II secretion system protein M [Woeseiaceae bacterium]
MKDWFESLESREQLFVGLGAVIVLVAIMYGFIWAPLDRNHDAMATSVDDWQRSLAELRPLKGLAQSDSQASGSTAKAGRQAPIIVVDQTLRSRGLEQFRRRSQPTSSNGIRVEFENVAFDELVLWLGDLSDQHAMHVQAGSLSTGSQPAPGRVNATLTLERAL